MKFPTLRSIILSAFFFIILVLGLELYLLYQIREEIMASQTQNLVKSIHTWMICGFILVLVLASLVVILIRSYRDRSLDKVQKHFINNFMHEFRTPVSVISIAGKVLQSDGIEFQPARLKQYAGIVKSQTDQLQEKVSRILEFALSEEKHSIFTKEKVDLNSVVSMAINFVQPLVDERKASIQFVQSSGLPSIHGDSACLTQVIVNLLDNSLKYANQPSIKVETSASEKSCSISVKDNGIGMENKYVKHIFRKFYRIPTGNIHNVKGFGIGLNFVKKVIDAHDGRIEVSSVAGKGTEFRIQLPLT